MMVLDIVEVRKEIALTNLGKGVIIDVDGTSCLVRFEHGSAKGLWYYVGDLTKLGSVLDCGSDENLYKKR